MKNILLLIFLFVAAFASAQDKVNDSWKHSKMELIPLNFY